MAALRMKLDGQKYEIDLDSITLGEAETLERDYGMDDFTDFNFMSAKQMVGLFFIAVQRANPEMKADEVRAQIEGIKAGPILEDINKQIQKLIADAEKKAENPPLAGANGKGSASASPPVARGRRKSANSTN